MTIGLVNPVYFDLSKHDQQSIILKPLPDRPPVGFVRKIMPPDSFVFLRVSLRDDVTGTQIADWLKSCPPTVVQGVDIEGLILQARRLENLKVEDHFFPNTILGSLSQPVQKEILRELKGLTDVMSETAAYASRSEGVVSPEPDFDVPLGKRLINEIQDTTSGICDTIEDGLLLDPHINLEQATADDAAIAVDAKDAITLRRFLHNSLEVPNALRIPEEIVTFGRSGTGVSMQRFQYGTVANRRVIVESARSIAMFKESPDAFEDATTNFKTTVAQLSQSKRKSFHILPCLGYIEESEAKAYSAVFAMHDGLSTNHSPVTLGDLYKAMPKVALGTRAKIAYTLAEAVGNLHRVGWVHKELKSDNILFFHQAFALGNLDISGMREKPDLGQPFLFGFDSSRPDDGATQKTSDYDLYNNVYRHPERWYSPLRKFQKVHDIYTLVCYTQVVSNDSERLTSVTGNRLPRDCSVEEGD